MSGQRDAVLARRACDGEPRRSRQSSCTLIKSTCAGRANQLRAPIVDGLDERQSGIGRERLSTVKREADDEQARTAEASAEYPRRSASALPVLHLPACQ
jgi:hypothetical protein